MQNTIDTQTKICACFNLSVAEYNIILADSNTAISLTNKELDFYYILRAYNMIEYKSFLYNYFTKVILPLDIKKYARNKKESIAEYEKKIELEEELTKILIFIMSEKSGTKPTITFQKTKDSITLKNETIFEFISKELIELYKINNFHKVNITYEAAIDRLLSNPQTADGVCPYPNEMADEVDQFYVQAYVDSNYNEMEINLDFLNTKLVHLGKNQKKPGAKHKNTILASLCEDLSYLKRIDMFLNNIDIVDIGKMSLSNKDCYFIRDLLLHFNIDCGLRHDSPSSNISSMIKQIKKSELENILFYQPKISKINNFKPLVNTH